MRGREGGREAADGASNGPTVVETPLRRRAAFFLVCCHFFGRKSRQRRARQKSKYRRFRADSAKMRFSPLRRRSTSIGNSLCRSIKSSAAVVATKLLLPKPWPWQKSKPKSLNHLCLPFLSSHDLTHTHSLTHSLHLEMF